MVKKNKYEICFVGRGKSKSFPTKKALADWIYEKLSQEIKPLEIRLLERIQNIKHNGTVVPSHILLEIWRAIERRREKNAQPSTSC
jgi:hypothetical protein